MKTFKEFNEACWDGYRQDGMKKKDGKMVPNCVPIGEVSQDKEIGDREGSQPKKNLRWRYGEVNETITC